VSELESFADVAKTASGDIGSAICEDCGLVFEHTKSGWTPVLVCPGCQEIRSQVWEQEERERTFARGMYDYRDNDLGTRLVKASFAEFVEEGHNRQALERAMEWVSETERQNLLIVGPIGCGKSYLAACVFNALLERYEPAYWLNAGSLMALIRRGFNDKDSSAEAGTRMERAERAPILVLDDLGKVHPGKDVSWVEETFYSIIEARYRNELPTVVTTEWKSAALAERVGQSVVSRLEDGAWVAGIKKPQAAYRKVQP
jgi:DNA replication protein DnaC